MSRMYTILQAMKPKFSRGDWVQMVEQAKEWKKITSAEYESLTGVTNGLHRKRTCWRG